MDESRFGLFKTAVFVLSFAAVYTLQRLLPWTGPRNGLARWHRNLPIGAVNTVLLSLACGGCLCAAARLAESWGIGLLRALPGWLAVAATIAALDLLSWAWHRANHRLGPLWRFHAVHHSDGRLDLTTALRFHAGELVLSLPIQLAAVALLGPPIEALLAFEAVFGLCNLYVHSDSRLPPRVEALVGRLFVVPALHRLHHSIDPAEHDRNFGTIFSIWDRALGTFLDGRSDARVVVGLGPFAGDRLPGGLALLPLPLHPGTRRGGS